MHQLVQLVVIGGSYDSQPPLVERHARVQGSTGDCGEVGRRQDEGGESLSILRLDPQAVRAQVYDPDPPFRTVDGDPEGGVDGSRQITCQRGGANLRRKPRG